MFSGTGELDRAVSAGLVEPSRPVSFSDTYGPARKYLKHRVPDAEVRKDFRDQIVPEGSIVTIGAPCQDLSVAGKGAGAERGFGTRSSLIAHPRGPRHGRSWRRGLTATNDTRGNRR